MSYNSPEHLNMPDLSIITESISKIQDIVRPVIEATQHFQELLRPIVEAASQYQSKMVETAKALADAFRPMAAIEKLGDAQYVYWEYIDDSFVETILSAPNIDTALRTVLKQDKYKSVNTTIELIELNPNMKKHLRLFSQSIEAYSRTSYNLALTGLTSVFDGMLATVSQNSTHKLKPRIDAIKTKLEKDEILNNDEYAMLSLTITLEKSLDSFSAFAPFGKPEPKYLNRNWIAHGRSTKKRTKLDCVKLINMIYGLILINKIEQKEAHCHGQY